MPWKFHVEVGFEMSVVHAKTHLQLEYFHDQLSLVMVLLLILLPQAQVAISSLLQYQCQRIHLLVISDDLAMQRV